MKHSENLLDLDFAKESSQFAAGICEGIIDVHTHINGAKAAGVFRKVMDLYGVETVYSMTPIQGVDEVSEVLRDRIKFIAIPKLFSSNPINDHGAGFIPVLHKFYELGSRIVKFWAAPRGLDFAEDMGAPGFLSLGSKQRRLIMDEASKLNMIFMAHVSDPDTWFATKYSDYSRYGTKADQYIILEELLAEYQQPWILAHMGGWPENLEFLTGLLDRHSNLYLDTSATKWMVRELSKHTKADFFNFMNRFSERILFGSDIVTNDQNLIQQSDLPGERFAFDLYASRYWSLRKLFETDYQGTSVIADPDLGLLAPGDSSQPSAPLLSGKQLPEDLLKKVYRDNLVKLMGSIVS